MKNRISEEVLLKLDSSTTAFLPLHCHHHGTQGYCSGEKEPTKRLTEKPDPRQLLSKGKIFNHTHVLRLHSHYNQQWYKGKSFRSHTE